MTSDVISVLIPVKNGQKYVHEAVTSVLNSDYSDLEVLVIDDGSNDNTADIVRKIAELDNRVRLCKNPSNGVSEALNYAISIAAGRYLARMDADDISNPSRFKKQVDFLKKNPSVALVGGQIKYFGEKIGVSKYPLADQQCKAFLFFSPCSAHPTYMFDRTRFDSADLLYCAGDNMAQDFEFLCRNASKYVYANLPDVVLNYRMHAEQVTNKSVARMKRVLEFLPSYWNSLGISVEKEGLAYILYPFSKNNVVNPSVANALLAMRNVFLSEKISLGQKTLIFKFFFKNQIKGIVRYVTSLGGGVVW